MSLPRFGVLKPVPVNLLMAATIIAGAWAAISITREFFPRTPPRIINVTLPYPGATPEEVEEGLAIKVEDAIANLDEVKQMRTTLAEGGGGITVELHMGVDTDEALREVERVVDSLRDLPAESETLQVIKFQPRLPVIMVTVSGDAGEAALKKAILEVRDDLTSLPGMGEVVVSGARRYEVRVDARYEALLEHGLSLPQVAAAVRAWMNEVPGGTVRTEAGNILVRTMGVPERAQAIRQIVVQSSPDGQALRVGDVATVSETFEDVEKYRRFNGKPSVSLIVFKVGDQDAVKMAKMVRAYVAGRKGEPYETRGFQALFDGPIRAAHQLGASSRHPLPGSIHSHSDLARFIEGRLDLLSRNAISGAILVFLTLLIFLNWRAALWVFTGLMTAVCGTLVLMVATGVTLNLLTMFGLIIVLGMLVDDAIVVAENIQTRHDRGETALQAAIGGAEQVLWPVCATVSTTIVAFLPLMFIRGQIGDLLGALPMVVTCALLMSLLESVLILPSHMGHTLAKRDRAKPSRWAGAFRAFERRRDRLIDNVIAPAFGRLLNLSLRFRYISASVALATLLVSIGLFAGGRVHFIFLGESDAETLVVDIRLPIGSPISETETVVRAIEQAAGAMPEVVSVSAIVGERQNVETGVTDVASSHLAQMYIELVPVEARDKQSSEVIAAIRAATEGRVGAADSVRYSEISGGPGGADITIEVTGTQPREISAAADAIVDRLRRTPGVFDVADDEYTGQREIRFTLKPGAAALGFTNENVALQVRGALYGIDAHTFAADREDIDVRVRLDEAARRNLGVIENLWVISPTGAAVPLVEIADIEESSSYASIKRLDRRRVVTVTADCAPGLSPEEVMAGFSFEEIQGQFPGVRILTGGRQRNFAEAFGSLPIGFAAALVMIYVILAWLFGSYVQPLAVMTAIPFGVIGVIWGHYLLGIELTFLSLIGFVALSGVVVNDSLILVEYYNHLRREGHPLREALVMAGVRRLRPIFLTTVTTVLGLTPLMLEQSFQARFLIPMAVAISFGLMSATVLILMVLPCLIVIIDDLAAAAHFLWHGETRAARRQREGLPVAPVATE